MHKLSARTLHIFASSHIGSKCHESVKYLTSLVHIMSEDDKFQMSIKENTECPRGCYHHGYDLTKINSFSRGSYHSIIREGTQVYL